jgi:hypothetical protein
MLQRLLMVLLPVLLLLLPLVLLPNAGARGSHAGSC